MVQGLEYAHSSQLQPLVEDLQAAMHLECTALFQAKQRHQLTSIDLLLSVEYACVHTLETLKLPSVPICHLADCSQWKHQAIC